MENSKKLFDELHNQYSLQKTLRFELKPIGKTKENIEQNGIITEDTIKAKNYLKVKKYCDEFHKFFIDDVLKDTKLQNLDQYYEIYQISSRDSKQKEEFKKIQENLRTQIANAFKKDPRFKALTSEELFSKYLPAMYCDDKEKLNEISQFDKFTTYFSAYYKNRENMYLAEEKSTAISYRLINQNLPTFLNNIKIFEEFSKKQPEIINKINKELEEYLQVPSVEEVFTLDYFNDVLTQKGIEVYNVLIAGKSKEKTKIKGINEYINEYNQKNKQRVPKLRELYKQILSDTNQISFKFDTIENDKELIELVDTFYNENYLTINNLNSLLSSLDTYNMKQVYINSMNINQISKNIFGEWNTIKDAIERGYDRVNLNGNKTDKYIENKAKYLKNKNTYSVSELEEIMKKESKNNEGKIVNYFCNYIKENNILNLIDENYNEFGKIEITESKLSNNEKSVETIKRLLDNIKIFVDFCKILIPKDNTIEKDDNFYNNFQVEYDKLTEIIPVYNMTRNYLTQKPYSDKKIKLNFDSPTLLDGWDKNKEKTNLGVLFVKDKNYYLGIMNPNHKNIFDKHIQNDNENKNYKKVVYKQLPNPNQNLPRIIFSKANEEIFNPPREILEKYNKGLHKKGENFDVNFCHQLIEFFKTCISKYENWKNFNFKFSYTSSYKDISEFYNEVAKQGYKITYELFDEEYINKLVDENKLYLFQIYNKDFSEAAIKNGSHQNLHTIYWKELFDEDNLKNTIYKLNGQAEVFYRKASIDINKTAKHEANNPIKNKNVDNPKKTSIFNYTLYKNKRYTEDKFLFHVPITINFNAEGINNINEKVNTFLKENDDNYVIGVDRGERNLIYICVINSKGKIIYQESLNIIKNEYKLKDNSKAKLSTNYHDLLDKKEENRLKQRQNWNQIENIKELKEGYLSQVIHKIAILMEKYNAVIVLEDLNNGFKNSRTKIEKQVYQKFEKMLIDKLNYLIFKDKTKDEQGGILNAYQLTNKFESFKKMSKQSGVLFYIPAWTTSKIDPTTGFINLFNFSELTNLDKEKEFISKFDDIRYNNLENYFEFDINYKNFTDRYLENKVNWTICSNGERILNFRNPKNNNEFENEKVNITNEFIELLRKYNIETSQIKNEILEKSDAKFFNAVKEKDGFNGLNRLFKLTIQMRNSIINNEEDYIISPVKNKYGKFYNSKDYADSNTSELPKDADANGAYNIARKGLMLINQIKNTEDKKLGKVKFNITNKEWLTFAQDEKNN